MSALEAEGLDGDGTVDSAKAGAFVLDTDDGRIAQRPLRAAPDLRATATDRSRLE